MKQIRNISILGIDGKALQTQDEFEKTRDLKVSDVLVAHATNVEEKGKVAVRALKTASSVYDQAGKEVIELEDAEFDLLYGQIEENPDKKLFRPTAIIYGRLSAVLNESKNTEE